MIRNVQMGALGSFYILLLQSVVSGTTTPATQGVPSPIISQLSQSSPLPASSEAKLAASPSLQTVFSAVSSLFLSSDINVPTSPIHVISSPSSPENWSPVVRSSIETSFTSLPFSSAVETVSDVLQTMNMASITSDAIEKSYTPTTFPSPSEASSETSFAVSVAQSDSIHTSSTLANGTYHDTALVAGSSSVQLEEVSVSTLISNAVSSRPDSSKTPTSNTLMEFSQIQDTSPSESALEMESTGISSLIVTSSYESYVNTTEHFAPQFVASVSAYSEATVLFTPSPSYVSIFPFVESFLPVNASSSQSVPVTESTQDFISTESSISYSSTSGVSATVTPILQATPSSLESGAFTTFVASSFGADALTTLGDVMPSSDYTSISTVPLTSSEPGSQTVTPSASFFLDSPSIGLIAPTPTITAEDSSHIVDSILVSTYSSSRTEDITPHQVSSESIISNTTTHTPVSTKPTIRLNTFRILISFKEGCKRIKTIPQLQMEFLESFVSVLTTVCSEITRDSIHLEDLKCNPLSIGILLSNVSRENVLTNIDMSMQNASFIVPVIDDGHIVKYTGETVSLITHKDKSQPKEEATIEQTEIIIIAIASFLFMVLLFFGSVIVCRECYLRKRAASFNLLDVPHVDLKLTDFTLTRIPRPHMIYFEPNRSNRAFVNGKHSSMCHYGTVVTESERLSVNAEHLHLRMHDHEEGLVIGVTCTPPQSPTHDTTSCSSSPRSESVDPSTQVLLKASDSKGRRKGTTNPNYTADDDLVYQSKCLMDDDKNEEIIML